MPLALALLHLVLALLAFHPEPHTGGDNAAYLALARSLLESGEYAEIWDPARRPHTMYPPVFPAILAAAMAVGLRGWIAMKLVVVVFSAAAVALSYAWLRRVAAPGVALAAGVVLAVAPGVLDLGHWIFSDVPFWTFTALALWAFAHVQAVHDAPRDADGDPGRRRADLTWTCVAVAATTLAYFTRSAGLPLVLAAAAWLAWRRRWRALGLLVGTMGPLVALWSLRARSVGAPGYVGLLWYNDPYRPDQGTVGVAGFVERFGANAANYLGEHIPLLLVGRPILAVGIAVVALALVGWARRLRRPGVAELLTPLYAGLLLAWPAVWSGERFFLPAMPLLLLYAGETLALVAGRLGRARVVGPVLAAAVVAAQAPGLVGAARTGMACTAAYRAGERYPCLEGHWRDYFVLAERTRGLLPEGAVVVARKATLFHALSGYRSRVYPLSADPDTFFAAARELGAEYVVVDQIPDLAPLYLHPVLLARRDDFCVIPELSLPNAALARIDTAGPPRAPGAAANAFRACPLGQLTEAAGAPR